MRLETRSRRGMWCALTIVVAALGACSGEDDPPGRDAVAESVIEENVLGTAYLGQQKWDDAEAAFRRALEQRPDDPLLLTNLGVALIQRGEYEQAEQALRRALEQDPDYPQAHYNLGLLQDRRGAFEEAASHFETVATQDPDDLHTLYYLGTAYSRLDRLDEAERTLRDALERDPTHVSSLYGLGRLLVRQGKDAEGAEMIALSQQIRARSGLDAAVGGQYGEQGPYAMGIDYDGDALAAPAPIEVRYVERAAVPADARAFAVLPLGDRRVVVAAGPSGLVAVTAEGRADLALPAFRDVRALAAGDVDDDGRVDLFALLGSGGTLAPALALQTGGGAFEAGAETSFTGAAALGDGSVDSSDLTLVDRDHDGDLDALWCATVEGAAASCALATNQGDGRFEVRPGAEHGIAPTHRGAGPVAVGFSDVDNDRDIDLLAAFPSAVELYGNQRDGSFVRVHDNLPGASALVIADMNKDGWMDLVTADDSGLRLALNRRGVFADPVPFDGAPAVDGAQGLAVLDHDNDGFLDVAVGTESGPVLLRNRGQGTFGAVDGALPGAAARPLLGFDADADGDLDLAAAGDGELRLLANEGGQQNRWVTLVSKGIGDNHFGIGAKVEILSGALRQKFEITRPLPVHAGLGQREAVQSARYLWPSGVLQDEVRLAAGGVEIEQLDRKGTSCPLLYAWRDGAWRFVTDFLGGSAVGYQVRPGVFSVPDSDEYVRLEGGLSSDAQGRLRLRLNNQLEEVIWFDQAALVVVDHPSGTEVHPNERLMPGPPFPEFRLYASSDVRPVAAARGVESGVDHRASLAARDRDWVRDFALERPKGYARPHTLELDLGAWPSGTRIVLLLDGWIDYADSSANVAAAQAGLVLEPPRLSVADGRGGWIERPGVIGFPAGLPKTMAVELTGLFPSADHRLRLATSMRIYWDRARVMLGGEATPLEVSTLAATSAVLGDGGFPEPRSPDGGQPFEYDPQRVERVSPFKAHAGTYTAFGDVTARLAAIDDRFVTTRNGDEIELAFAAPPPPRPGMTRTYLLFADGFGKDMDPNSAAPSTVGPFPYHGMPAYPYGDGLAPPIAEEPPGRRVTDSPQGTPGALPQALASRLR